MNRSRRKSPRNAALNPARANSSPSAIFYRYELRLMSEDVMGAVYERFLAHNLRQDGGRIILEDTDELRKKEGIYYTPRYIVDYIVAHTLGEKINQFSPRPRLCSAIKISRVRPPKSANSAKSKSSTPRWFRLIPAGAFDALIAAYAGYNAECRQHKSERNGGGMLFERARRHRRGSQGRCALILTENLHGVDLDAQAVEVAKLNFWIRYMAVERDAMRETLRREKRTQRSAQPPARLVKKFKRGNSLIDDKAVAGEAAFDWKKQFPEIMKRGGFDVVVGIRLTNAFR